MNKIEELAQVAGPETPKNRATPTTEFITEDDLCTHLKRMRAQEVGDGIRLKWELGATIRDHYKTEHHYGYDQLGVIARKSGWSKSTLQKACQFAEKYSEEQVETLLQGHFGLAWRDIAQNLCVETQAFIIAYSTAQTSREFRNSVMQLRQSLQGGTQPPKPITRKELERMLAESRQKIADLENRIQALQAKPEELTSNDELVQTRGN